MHLARYTLEIVCLAALVVGASVGSIFTALNATHRGGADDAWRRTASGWERASSWQPTLHGTALKAKTSYFGPRATAGNRWDTHPAALALVQIIGVLGILRFVPRRTVVASRSWRILPDTIVRSYRASFFGS